MFKYTLRLQLPPTLNFEERLNNMLDFCEKAKIDDVMFFVGCEDINTGHITIEEAKPYADVIRSAGKYLKERGISVSLNPWMTLGHYDGGKTFKKGQNFRGMVGHDGAQAKLCVCPLCGEWRKYYVELLNFYVKTLAPDTIWLEDDFRMRGHGADKVIEQGCFCEEHMRLYNERLGTSYDRETFVSLIGTDEKARKVYLDICRETMEGTMQYIVDNVKGQKRFGLMTGGAGFVEARRLSVFFDVLATGGREKPFNRLSVATSRQFSPQVTGRSFQSTALLNRYMTGDKAHCFTEIENNPHTLYTKSVRFNKFQQLNAIPALLSGATFSIFEFNGNGAINYERLAKMYAEIKPYLSRAEELKISPYDMTGVRILVNEDVAYTAKVLSGDYIKNYEDSTGYFAAWFELLGINCRYEKNADIKGKVVAVSGQVLRSLSKAQIESLFANNFVIINGDGVEALFDMGLNGLIDAKSYEVSVERHGRHTFEEINSGEKLQGISKMRATSNWSAGNYVRIEYGDKEKTVHTNMMDCHQNVYGCGLTVVGNVLVEPHKTMDTSVTPVPYALYHPLREHVLKTAIKKSGLLKNETFFVQEENVAPYSFKKDGKTVLMCVNFCDDDYESLTIETGKEYNDIQIITVSDVVGHKANVSYRDGVYTIKEELKGMESYILLIS